MDTICTDLWSTVPTFAVSNHSNRLLQESLFVLIQHDLVGLDAGTPALDPTIIILINRGIDHGIAGATSNVAPFACFVCNRKINQLEVITIFQIDIRQSCFYYRYLGLRIILPSIFLSSTSQEVMSPNVYDSPQEIRTFEHGILSFD